MPSGTAAALIRRGEEKQPEAPRRQSDLEAATYAVKKRRRRRGRRLGSVGAAHGSVAAGWWEVGGGEDGGQLGRRVWMGFGFSPSLSLWHSDSFWAA